MLIAGPRGTLEVFALWCLGNVVVHEDDELPSASRVDSEAFESGNKEIGDGERGEVLNEAQVGERLFHDDCIQSDFPEFVAPCIEEIGCEVVAVLEKTVRSD